MSKCPDFNLLNAVGDLFSGLGIGSSLISADRLAVEMSKVNGILDFPMVIKLLDDAVQFLSSTVVGASDGFVQAIRQVSDESLATIGGLVSIVGTVATLGTQFGTVTGLFMVEQLKRELRIRIIYHQLILYHIEQILVVLKDYQTSNSTNFYKLTNALRHVRKAEQYMKKVSYGQDLGVTPNMEYYVMTQAFNRIDAALRVLRTNTEGGQSLLSRNPKSTANFLFRRFNVEVLGRAVNRLEILNWNMSHIAKLFPSPNITVSFSENLDNVLPGYTGVKFSSSDADGKLTAYRKKQLEAANLSKRITTKLREIDLAKGLVPTNVLIAQLISQLKTFDVDWPNLEILCRNILANMSPALPIVQEVREDMEGAYGDDEYTLAAKSVNWIVKLSTVSSFRAAFATALEGQLNTLGSIKDIIDLKSDLEKFEASTVAGKIPEFLVLSLELIGKASFSKKALEQALVYNTTGKMLIQKAVKQDKALLLRLEHVPDVTGMPAFQLFGQLLTAMDNLPAPANVLANAFRTGQLSEIMSGLTALTAYGNSITSALGSFDCVKKQPAPIDEEQETQRQIKQRREEALGQK